MNQQVIKDLLELIKNTDIEEFKYKNISGEYIYLHTKKLTNNLRYSTDIKYAEDKGNTKTKNKENDNNNMKTIVAIKSTMVGTFSNFQLDGIPLLIKPGDNIEIGQKVGQIEAMKLIKDVCSKIKGKVTKVLIENGQTVEYGQELFLLEC
jgi:acetyl-CoA carboxylase biotin carboxyl carrier protein